MLGWVKKYSTVVILALIMVQFMAVNVQAVDDITKLNQEYDKGQTPAVQAPSLGWETLKMLFVLALIVVAAWSIIRLFSRQVKRRLQGNWLHVVDEVMLGQNRGIVLCEVGQKLYALGVTDHNIALLFEIDNPQVLREISQMTLEGESREEGVSLKRMLDGWMGKNAGPAAGKNEFHQLMEEQVSRMRSISLPGSGKPGSSGRGNAEKEPK